MKYFLYIILVALSINANTLTYEVSANYVMGDNDTKLEARKIALEQAKKIALEQAGTYIEVKTIVKNGKLTTDEIKSFGASVLKTKIINEKYFFKGNSPILEILVESKIDMDILNKNIKQAKNNKSELQKRIKLQKENEKLLNKIEELKNDFKSREKRNKLITKIEKNNNQLIKTFKKGSLLTLSKNYKKKTDDMVRDIRNNNKIFKSIKNSTKVNVGDIEVKNNNDNTSDVHVYVDWVISDYKKILKVLNQYLDVTGEWKNYANVGHGKKKIEDSNVVRIIMSKDKKRQTDELPIYKALLEKQVLVEMSIGKYKKYVAIFTGIHWYYHPDFHGYLTVDKYGSHELQLTLHNSRKKDHFRNNIFIENPIIFKNIPDSVLANIDSVKSKIIITKPIFKVK